MKLFKKESLGYKIIIAAVIVLLFNFMAPTLSFAEDAVTKVGGILFEPIKDLLLALADGIISITQSMLFKMDSSFLSMEHNNSNAATIVGWVVRNSSSSRSSSRSCISTIYSRS